MATKSQGEKIPNNIGLTEVQPPKRLWSDNVPGKTKLSREELKRSKK